MASKMPNSRRNLDMAIERVFGATDNPYEIRTVMANTIIGQLLPDGVVKGGSSLKLRYGEGPTRFTTDLDAARAVALDTFLSQLDVALQKGWNGFTGKIVPKEPAQPEGVPAEYIMQPFAIKLDYNTKSWVTVQLEVGHDEVGDTVDPDYSISPDIVAIFEKLGFPAPKPVALMPIPHQIAQKLHAVSAPGGTRAHDLIDLQVIAAKEMIDRAKTRDACQRLFKSRGLQVWPPVVVKGSNWDSLYAGQLRKLDVLQSVDEAVTWVNQFIENIVDARSKKMVSSVDFS